MNDVDTERLVALRAVAAKSKKPLPWYGLAMELRSVGRLAEAAATFAALHEKAPAYVPGYFMHGQLLAELGRSTDAVKVLREGIEQAHTQGDGHAASEMQELLDTLVDA